ncbi:betaine-aldehyde dehydrogenase [Rhizobium sp. ERR 922]|uniref:aldehyde dehydrogenase family protein n=1 Tax=unclassified Rhizobium TaxID=2613769 RepID=UPI00119DD535|nr:MULTISPECIES: aldehyde dehydrogenase family protein [unclassified Rhizobium]TWB53111.1 betaine-aldehyde dehydrogenase [Rhizobium sp. ERR 922]TWB95924.1 betaine-aldehyde dehydrogenase [Rhizobium sp. ERR 942]
MSKETLTTAGGAPLPIRREAYYGGSWHVPLGGRYTEITSPADEASLGPVADCDEADVEAAVEAAIEGFKVWRDVVPLERARLLRQIANLLRDNADTFALIDALDCGNPYSATKHDALIAAETLDFFAGLVTEMKGASVPLGPSAVNFTLREPLGVVARIYPFNHPLLFCGSKMAAPLAAGNSIIVKPPQQAPLSTLKLIELIDGILPAGVLNMVPGGRSVGATLAQHPKVAKVALTGSLATGKAVMRSGADTLKKLSLELGGKNALIAYPDAEIDKLVDGIVRGMNFHWCSGQSCGSTSRVFLHKDIYEQVVEAVRQRVASIRQGIPTDPQSEMGAIIDKSQFDKIMSYISGALGEGARLVTGGARAEAPELRKGYFIQPTVFADVTQDMRIAREEIFGPVLSILEWEDETKMLANVNAVDYGLTASIWTTDISTALKTVSRVEAGYIWINDASVHYLGTPFGGTKQSGFGREECLDELLSFTEQKTVTVRL